MVCIPLYTCTRGEIKIINLDRQAGSEQETSFVSLLPSISSTHTYQVLVQDTRLHVCTLTEKNCRQSAPGTHAAKHGGYPLQFFLPGIKSQNPLHNSTHIWGMKLEDKSKFFENWKKKIIFVGTKTKRDG
tara:strand:+ start:274 stop:663 length:390 start_codon:yes stop_codon:yes gene_type:complete